MISIRHVHRSFGDKHVLDDVNFDIKPGLMTGFVGGNGAGKTTTMRILLGVLAPDAGEVLVDGSPITQEYRANIGYMPEERGLYPKMKVIDQIVYLARLHGVPSNQARSRGLELLERLGLNGKPTDTLESLSLGNQQRAQIAAALIHDPVALILDEPFSGLDPDAVEVTLGVLRDVAATGAPVLFSSHQLDLVEQLCDELVIIANGQIRATGTRQELLTMAGAREWELVSDTDTGWLRQLPIDLVFFDGGVARFRTDDPHLAHDVLATAVSRGRIEKFGPVHRTLRDAYKELTR